ncbi:MAG TPA: alkaline phosphatase family protein [Candidatus Acidoferrales bacterium]|nr:alkaline phosphatase family protein [Candidatus Acidoferrales bacterium]
MTLSRADLIKLGIGTAASLGLGYGIQAPAIAADGLKNIDHFVILMQENRSFDHYFGTLSGVRGFSDPSAHKLPNGNPVFRQPDDGNPDGYELPFHLDTKTTSAIRLRDLSHEWDPQHASLDGGAMDAWLPAHRKADGQYGPLTMGYYTRDDIPFHYALADAFTVCDAYHCSVLGPTYPNRLLSMTGSIDAAGTHGGPAINNDALRGGIEYTWETYPERLERAGISWQITYDLVDDFLMNVMRYFKAYRTASPTSDLLRRSRRARPIDDFLSDLRTGNLPQVTWILGHAEQTEHPSYYPTTGAQFVHTLLDALWSNQRVWARTAFILMYDENDGQFDHVVPPLPPPGTPGEFIGGRPIGLGFRVPCVVISPYSRGGFVCSETFDHTSVLRLLEKRFGVEVPNLSAWRRKTCGDLTSAFDFASPPRLDIPKMPNTTGLLETSYYVSPTLPQPTVPKIQQMPTQEPGTRPRRVVMS